MIKQNFSAIVIMDQATEVETVQWHFLNYQVCGKIQKPVDFCLPKLYFVGWLNSFPLFCSPRLSVIPLTFETMLFFSFLQFLLLFNFFLPVEISLYKDVVNTYMCTVNIGKTCYARLYSRDNMPECRIKQDFISLLALS